MSFGINGVPQCSYVYRVFFLSISYVNMLSLCVPLFSSFKSGLVEKQARDALALTRISPSGNNFAHIRYIPLLLSFSCCAKIECACLCYVNMLNYSLVLLCTEKKIECISLLCNYAELLPTVSLPCKYALLCSGLIIISKNCVVSLPCTYACVW